MLERCSLLSHKVAQMSFVAAFLFFTRLMIYKSRSSSMTMMLAITSGDEKDSTTATAGSANACSWHTAHLAYSSSFSKSSRHGLLQKD